MKSAWLSALVVVLLAGAPARPQEPEARGIAGKLLGTWNIVAGEVGGKKEPPERIKDTTVEFTRDRVVVTNKDATRTYRATYKLDLKHKPYAIVMKAEGGADKGKVAQGIFRLESDQLTMCYALPGSAAPTEFRTAPGDRRMLFFLRRAK